MELGLKGRFRERMLMWLNNLSNKYVAITDTSYVANVA